MQNVFDLARRAGGQVVTLLSLLAGLALVLGAVGVYGVISHYVTRRSRDYGIASRSARRRPASSGRWSGAARRWSRSAARSASPRRSPQRSAVIAALWR